MPPNTPIPYTNTENANYTNYNYPQNRKKLILLSIISLVVIMAIAIVFVVINLQKSATLDIIVAPTSATINLDGHKFSTYDTIKYYPGTYTVEISAQGFITQSIQLELAADQKSHLYVALEPTSDNSNYYELSTAESDRLQEVYDASFTVNSEQYAAKYPIINILPYNYSAQDDFGSPIGYRIDYGQYDDCDSDFCLKVTGYLKTSIDEAKEYLKSRGFNPDDYQIFFDYTPIEKASPEDFPEDIRKIMEEAGYFD